MSHRHVQVCIANPPVLSFQAQLKRKREEYENTIYLQDIVRRNPTIFTDLDVIPTEEAEKRIKTLNEHQEVCKIGQNKSRLDEIEWGLKGIKNWLEHNPDFLNDSSWVIRLDYIKSTVKCHRKKQVINSLTVKIVQDLVSMFYQEMNKPPVSTESTA